MAGAGAHEAAGMRRAGTARCSCQARPNDVALLQIMPTLAARAGMCCTNGGCQLEGSRVQAPSHMYAMWAT